MRRLQPGEALPILRIADVSLDARVNRRLGGSEGVDGVEEGGRRPCPRDGALLARNFFRLQRPVTLGSQAPAAMLPTEMMIAALSVDSEEGGSLLFDVFVDHAPSVPRYRRRRPVHAGCGARILPIRRRRRLRHGRHQRNPALSVVLFGGRWGGPSRPGCRQEIFARSDNGGVVVIIGCGRLGQFLARDRRTCCGCCRCC